MTGSIPIKHVMKQSMGLLAGICSSIVVRPMAPGLVVLMYHRVSKTGCMDWSVDSWNVDPGRFERQVAWLAANTECLRLGEIPLRLAEPVGGRPRVLVTFDDGFGNFYDRWGRRNRGRTRPESWLPLTWGQVEEAAATGLVTFGSHSETHPEGATLGAEGMLREAAQSRASLVERLGEAHAMAYAYPYGSTRLGHVNKAYREAVRQAGFSMGFTTDLGVLRPGLDPFGLPRIEAHGGDGAAVIAAKARGVLWPYRLTDALRRAKRAPRTDRLAP